MQDVYKELQKRDTAVIAISQEEQDLKSAKKFLKAFVGKRPPFAVAADLNRKSTARFDRTTTYFIDKTGVVRQVFPMLIHHRASWATIVNEIDRLLEGS